MLKINDSNFDNIKNNNDENLSYENNGENEQPIIFGGEQSSNLNIETFTRNLTEKARKGEFQPFFGRESEIFQIISILIRIKKNNVILLGEAGVGKTALVEALTMLIYQKDPIIPEKLYNKKVYEVDLSALTAGTRFRGEFEERINFLINWAKKEGDSILFFDEIHVILGSENFNASNFLKPALARSEFLCIGATTLDEYDTSIGKDKALIRRFKNIIVGELNEFATKTILTNLKFRYENHYNISISDDVLDEVIDLSQKYIKDQYLPDKALDLLDTCCAQFSLIHQQTIGKKNEVYDIKLKSDLMFLKNKKLEAIEKDDILNSIYFSTKYKELSKKLLNEKITIDPISYNFYNFETKNLLDIKEILSYKIKRNLSNKNLKSKSEYPKVIKTIKIIQNYSINSLYFFIKNIKLFSISITNLYKINSLLLKYTLLVKLLNEYNKIKNKKYNSNLDSKSSKIIFKKLNLLNEKEKTISVFLEFFDFASLLYYFYDLFVGSKIKTKYFKPLLAANYVGMILSSFIKIPINPIQSDEDISFDKKEEYFSSKVYGQSHVITTIMKVIKMSYTGIRDKNRPISSFFFAGSTGVGKTEVAKILAEILFGDRKSLITIDMADYQSAESISKLTGTAPGYIGYEQGGFLTEQVRKNPYSIVLFDEVEKAHKSIFNIFLQILEEGRVRDNRKRLIDFTNTIIILTSNIGAEHIISTFEELNESSLELFESKIDSFLIKKNNIINNNILTNNISPLSLEVLQYKRWEDIINSPELRPKLKPFINDTTNIMDLYDYTKIKEEITQQLLKELKPEIVNRLDHIVIFNCLSKMDLSNILYSSISLISNRVLKDYSIEIICTPSFCNYLVEKSYDLNLGARPIRRNIVEEIENEISAMIIEDNIPRIYKKKQISKNTNYIFSKISNSFNAEYFSNMPNFFEAKKLLFFKNEYNIILNILKRNLFCFNFLIRFYNVNFNNKTFSSFYWTNLLNIKNKNLKSIFNSLFELKNYKEYDLLISCINHNFNISNKFLILNKVYIQSNLLKINN